MSNILKKKIDITTPLEKVNKVEDMKWYDEIFQLFTWPSGFNTVQSGALFLIYVVVGCMAVIGIIALVFYIYGLFSPSI